MNKRNYLILCITPDECSLLADVIQLVLNTANIMSINDDLVFKLYCTESEIKTLENLKKRFV